MLTAKKVERVTAPGRYHDGHGLYLQVVNANNKSWLLRYERGGRERWYGLGPTHTFSLKEAREKARAARQLLHDGIDPIDARRSQRAAARAADATKLTFREATARFVSQHEASWTSPKHAAQYVASLRQHAWPGRARRQRDRRAASAAGARAEGRGEQGLSGRDVLGGA
jgi:Arm DNA-binding domain